MDENENEIGQEEIQSEVDDLLQQIEELQAEVVRLHGLLAERRQQ